jgi:ribonuclease-3
MGHSFRLSPDEYSEKDLNELEEKIGVRFQDQVLLIKAVIRSAYVKEVKDKQPDSEREDNERLEFLGDSVLELAVRHYLYEKYEEPEGILSKKTDDLVCEDNLTRVADCLDLGKYLFLGGTEVSDERGKPAILADALEAIIAGVYLDQGLCKAVEIMEKLILHTNV